ncbi:hypothetical protein JXB41_03920 [Candidatus Woesearchaeota archaeon]|nr:hypothetical protein [Candidatus Woesearchaeota archaeon]
MNLVKSVFNEIVLSSLFVIFFDSMFTGILFFGVSCLILSFLNLSLIYSVIPGLLFFILSFFRKLRINKLLKLEQKYPELKEKLRTSNDYKEKNNPVVLALHTEVINLVTNVDINALVSRKNISLKVICISLLFFFTIFISSLNFNINNITRSVAIAPVDFTDIKNRANDFIKNTINFQLTQDYLENGSVAELGDQELNLSIETYSTDIDVSQIENPEKKEFGETYPEEIEGYAQEVYEDKITEEHKDVIKTYFDQLKEG